MHSSGPVCTVLKVVAVFTVLSTVAHAYPEYFIENGYANSCTSHPAMAYGGHKAPVQDRNIAFQLADAAAAASPASSVCPGVKYTLTVGYGGASRRALLTVSEGKLAGATDPTCPNRSFSTDGASDAYTETFTLPCTTKAKNIELKVTSAEGSRDAFHQATSTVTVKPVGQCPSSTCPGAPAATPATPKPATSAVPAAATAASAAAVPASSSASSSAAAKPADDDALTAEDRKQAVPTATAATAVAPAAATAKNAQQSGGGCGQSSYGYACKVDLQQGASLHYTKGGVAPPTNPCTNTIASGDKAQMQAAAGSSAEPVHFLLETPLTGYAGLSFPVRKGRMYPADAVIGWVDPATAQPKVSAYALTDYSPAPSSTNSKGLGWASNMGAAAAAGSNGNSGTLLCFSRMSDAPAAQSVKALNLAGMDMNWVGHNSDQFEQHMLTGQVTVNMNTGAVSGAAASGVDERRMRAVLAHGALMLLAFIVFFPLGALTARHKWLAGDKVNGGIRASWFHGHRASQMLALLLALAGFILALVVFDVSWRLSDPTPHRLYDLHRFLGLVVMAFVVVQAVAGIARPKLDSRYRSVWRFGHMSLGWLTTGLGVVVAFVGVVIMHDLRQQPWVNWLLPMVLLLGLLVVVGTVLEAFKYKYQRSGQYQPTTHNFGESPKRKPTSSDREEPSVSVMKNAESSSTRVHDVKANSVDVV